jgi:hypothetical protein
LIALLAFSHHRPFTRTTKEQFAENAFIFPAVLELRSRTERIFSTILAIILPKMRSVRILGRI